MKTLLDAYNRRARFEPAVLVALPLGLATLAWFPAGAKAWALLWGFIAWSGGTTLLLNVARDSGKRKEPELFRRWGGKPSTRMLRHRDTANAALLRRRHEKLKQLLPSLRIPTAAQEAKDPAGADTAYESAVAFLIEKTRDTKVFDLLFAENCNYGFRRNLWGLKPTGISLATIGVVGTAALLIRNYMTGAALTPLSIGCLTVNVLLLLGWIFWFTPDWIKIPADAYAERLLASCDQL